MTQESSIIKISIKISHSPNIACIFFVNETHSQILGFLDFRKPGISLFLGQFSPEFSPADEVLRRISEIGLDTGLDGKGAIQLHSGGTFSRCIQVRIDICMIALDGGTLLPGC